MATAKDILELYPWLTPEQAQQIAATSGTEAVQSMPSSTPVAPPVQTGSVPSSFGNNPFMSTLGVKGLWDAGKNLFSGSATVPGAEAGFGSGVGGEGFGAGVGSESGVGAGVAPETSSWFTPGPINVPTAAIALTALGNKALSNAPQAIQQGWGVANPVAGPVSLASGGRWKDVAFHGGKLSPMEAASLALPTAGYSLLHNSLFGQGGVFGSGKSSRQLRRDKWRKQLREAGLTDDNGVMTLPNGETFDFSSGNPDYRIGYGDEDYKKGEVNYDRYGNTIGEMQTLGALLAPTEGTGQDITGYFVNMVSRSSDPEGTAQYLWNTFVGEGMDARNAAYEAVLNSKDIPDADKPAHLAAIDKRYGVINPNQGKGGEEEFGSVVYPMVQKAAENTMKPFNKAMKNPAKKAQFIRDVSSQSNTFNPTTFNTAMSIPSEKKNFKTFIKQMKKG